MKFAVFFLVCLVALAAAAPLTPFIATYPGFTATGARTLVTGPTVVNGFPGTVPIGTFGNYYGTHITPGYFGAYTI